MTTQLNGILTALVTPFTENNELDVPTLRKVVDHSINSGVDGVVAGGGTGEWVWLSDAERLRLFDTVIEQASGQVPVIAQTGAMNTANAVRLSRAAEKAGADILFLAAPYYEPLTKPELAQYIKTVASAVQIPVMIYNNPSVFGLDLSIDDITGLARDVENIRYVKDSSADWEKALRLIHYHHDQIGLIMGWDSFTFSALVEGAVGVMDGTANVLPRELSSLACNVRSGNIVAAREEWNRIFPVVETLTSLPFVSAVKAGMQMRGLPVGLPREPQLPLSADDAARLMAALNTATHVPELQR